MYSKNVAKYLEKQHQLHIGGEWLDADSGEQFDVINPANKQVIAKVAKAGKKDVDLAVKAARQALHGPWGEISAAERGRILWKWADLLEQNLAEIAEIEVLDNGMPMVFAQTLGSYGVEWIRYYAGMTDKIVGKNMSSVVSGNGEDYHAYTSNQPIGVVGMILPWNGPFGTFLIKAAPALAAGCCCVVKPAEDTPLNALKIAELAQQAGIPAGVLNVITGFGDAGAALVEHPDVDKISFTGSTETGKQIVRAASKDLKRITLELGGKSPCIIFDDADLQQAIPAASMAIFANSGQICFAGSRLYVHKKVYDQVVDGIVEFSKHLKIGSGFDPETMLGPLISQKQWAQVNSYVEAGKKAGAQLLVGADEVSDEGFFYSPTIFANTTADMSIVREEIFGPVLVATPFDDVEMLIEWANDTPYGLGSGVFSENINTIHHMANRIQAGTVWANHYGGMHPTLPFGGFKQSGWGRELSEDGFLAYTEKKTVNIKLSVA